MTSPRPTFAPGSAFWHETRGAVHRYLATEKACGRPAVADPRLLRKAILVLIWFALSYLSLLQAQTLAAVLLSAISLAFASAALGFGVFHDANHGTLFHRARANRNAARLCCVLLGPSRHFWLLKHQGLHHRQPNVIGWDDDVDARGFLRLTPACDWNARFRRQEIKALAYYSLSSLEWFFWKDFRGLIMGRLNPWQPITLTNKARVEFAICKGLYLTLFVLTPFLALPPMDAIAAFFVFHLVLSWLLAAVFQVAHLTAGMAFGPVRAGDDWAMHQMRTTANFGTTSLVVTWFTGGLNHQIEHHLFPNVAHTHYPALRPIVRAAAVRHGLPYHDLGGMRAAVRQHFALLKTLGAGD